MPLGLSAIVFLMTQSMAHQTLQWTTQMFLHWQWCCIQSGNRTNPSMRPSLEEFRTLSKSSRGCRGASCRRLFESQWSGAFHSMHCSMMFFRGKDLVCAAPPSPESCLFLSELPVHNRVNSAEKNSAEYFGRYRQHCDPSPIVTVLELTFLGELNNRSLGPVWGNCFLFPDASEEVCEHIGWGDQVNFQHLSMDWIYAGSFSTF